MIEFNNTIVVIPSRMASVRLPGKPLADIHGIPMIVHVWKRAVEANVGKVLVAAAENEIADAIRSHGGDALATDPALRSGSDRVAAALKLRDPQGKFTAVVNLQGDLPTIDPLAIQRCLAGLTNETVDSHHRRRIDTEAMSATNIVKTIAPRRAVVPPDFVRSPVPSMRALLAAYRLRQRTLTVCQPAGQHLRSHPQLGGFAPDNDLHGGGACGFTAAQWPRISSGTSMLRKIMKANATGRAQFHIACMEAYRISSRSPHIRGCLAP
jgi:CMP-2-keto-3-deoxyoctulosonic acid synthetase